MRYRYNPGNTDCTACSGVLHPNICEPDLSSECRAFLKLSITVFVLANNMSDFDKSIPKNIFGIFIPRYGACFILQFPVDIMKRYNGTFLQKNSLSEYTESSGKLFFYKHHTCHNQIQIILTKYLNAPV